ncbi:MAG: hypothetical protein J3Q66DRAFT_407309 [Benniella sp.]|nr:MAG: hypothetical protein J3Q66DRAFT_407309 [Benniella sp.]
MALLDIFRSNKQYRESGRRKIVSTQHSQLHPLYLPEILQLVFSYLSQHTLKNSIRYVCKEWFAAARPMIHLQALWKDRIGNNYNHHFLLARLDQVTHLRVLYEQLWMVNNTQYAWRELIETVNSLSLSGRLHITTLILNRVNFLESRVYALLPKLTTLAEIRIDKMVQATIHLGVVLALCPTLLELTIDQSDYNHEIKDNMDPCWPGTTSDATHSIESRIRRLTIKGMQIEQSSFERILSRCPHLNHLKLVGLLLAASQMVPFDRPRFFSAISTSCPLLEYFHLSFQDLRMTSQDASALVQTFFSIDQPSRHAQNPPRQPRLTTLSLFDKDVTQDLHFYSYPMCANNTLTSLEILATYSLSASRFVSQALHDLLCITPTLIHVVAPQIPYFAEYLDLNGVEDDVESGYYFPRLCKRDRPISQSHRLRRKMWACRGLRTLRLQFCSLESDHPSPDNARIMFGYIARACPELRELGIERRALNMTLKGGMCLLTRIKHLERLTIVTSTRVKLERKDLEWLTQHPAKRSKLTWLQKKPKIPQRFQAPTTAIPDASSSITLRDSSSGMSIGTDDDISIHSTRTSELELWTLEDMKHVGATAEMNTCRQEIAEHGCWPKLSFLGIQCSPMLSTRIVLLEDYLPAIVYEVRPDIEFSCDSKRW